MLKGSLKKLARLILFYQTQKRNQDTIRTPVDIIADGIVILRSGKNIIRVKK